MTILSRFYSLFWRTFDRSEIYDGVPKLTNMRCGSGESLGEYDISFSGVPFFKNIVLGLLCFMTIWQYDDHHMIIWWSSYYGDDTFQGSYSHRKYMVCMPVCMPVCHMYGLQHHIVEISGDVTMRDGQTNMKKKRLLSLWTGKQYLVLKKITLNQFNNFHFWH